MAEILELFKSKLQSVIEVDCDENNLIIILNVKGEIQKSDILAEPHEVKDMLRILGGLTEDVSMEIEIDNKARKIKIVVFCPFATDDPRSPIVGIMYLAFYQSVNVERQTN